jgi:hypothetical protein
MIGPPRSPTAWHLDLAAAKSEGRGLLEKLREMLVAEMEIEAARVGAHARVVPAEKAIERQTGLLRRKVPARLVDGLLERQRQAADIAAARPADAVDQPGRRLSLQARPRLLPKDPLDLRQRRQRVKQTGHEAEADPASIGHQLERRIMGVGDMNLAVADYAVTRILKPR